MLVFDQIQFSYPGRSTLALCDVCLTVAPGERVVLLGANGSGKSTLARLANGLLLPQSGSVRVDGMHTALREGLRELRTKVGVVAQDPDNQIVSATVLDDVAFGVENLGLPREQIAQRCADALAAVGLAGAGVAYEQRDPNTLSGGEKQRLVLAGILAMEPTYLVLDEPTSMLDHEGRVEVEAVIDRLHGAGHGILHITHELAYVRGADRVCVLNEGFLVYNGLPAVLLADEAALVEWGLAVPLPDRPTRVPLSGIEGQSTDAAQDAQASAASALVLRDVSYAYAAGTSFEHPVLQNVNLTVSASSYTLISGHTGSGKSTLLRIAAGLLAPTSGTVAVEGGGEGSSACSAPERTGQTEPTPLVGLVFQNPESQLFAATVAEDILFGPKNLGLTTEGIVASTLQAVGLDHQAFADRSPFTLSGGETRRVAIATVLAMQPRFLLLDEPTAGLDARGRAFVHAIIATLLAEGVGVVVVSHDVDEFEPFVDTHLELAEPTWPS